MRILDGKNTTEGEFPSFLQLGLYGHVPICGAVLLDSVTALTVAHCLFFEKHNLPLAVTAGAFDLWGELGDEFDSLINCTRIHENYDNETKMNDIAILKLATPIAETPTVKYAKLPFQDVPLNTFCTTVGFGLTIPNDSSSKPYLLQKAKILVRRFSDCYVQSAPWEKRDFYLCGISVKGQHLLEGDSGGPLYCNISNETVVSGLVAHIAELRFTHFIDVFKYRDWIENNRY